MAQNVPIKPRIYDNIFKEMENRIIIWWRKHKKKHKCCVLFFDEIKLDGSLNFNSILVSLNFNSANLVEGYIDNGCVRKMELIEPCLGC